MQHTDTGTQDQSLLFHPFNVMLSILLLGLSVLFVGLTVSYVYIRVTMGVPPIKAPWLFILNTALLLGSSYTMIQAKNNYLNDQTEAYKRNLLYTILLSFVFAIMQGVAWYLLFQNNIALNTSTTAAFLYLISFVHLAHVIAGLPFLILFYYKARKRMVDPVTVLVYFSDPEKRLRLKLLTRYWHFLDALWIYLIVFFLINMLF